MSVALSLMELTTGGGGGVGRGEAGPPGPISQRNPALGKLTLFDLAV